MLLFGIPCHPCHPTLVPSGEGKGCIWCFGVWWLSQEWWVALGWEVGKRLACGRSAAGERREEVIGGPAVLVKLQRPDVRDDRESSEESRPRTRNVGTYSSAVAAFHFHVCTSSRSIDGMLKMLKNGDIRHASDDRDH